MNILISNDDGINAPGIKKLTRVLSGMPGSKVYVCAPDRERSCIGHGLTMFEDLFLYDCPPDEFGSAVWVKSCSGTPGDCIRLALCVLAEENVKIDLVCSGINNGGNTGSDINYSGTFAACREALLDGYPSIAFSCTKGLDYIETFDVIVPFIMQRFSGKIPEDTSLNVNVPNLPMTEIKGYKAASLARLSYPPLYTEMYMDEEKEGVKRYAFASYYMESEGLDEFADTALVKDGWITVSIVPLLPDMDEARRLTETLLSGTD